MSILPSDYLKIYTADPKELEDDAIYTEAYNRLPAFRRSRADSYKNKIVKLESVAAFSVLIFALKQAGLPMDSPSIWEKLDWRITEKEKPYFAGIEGVHFSLSHTKGAVLCALSGTNIGCDIEVLDRKVDIASIERLVLSDDEREGFDMNDRSAFFRIWTRKEAFVKYTGEGLGAEFSSFSVDNVPVPSFTDVKDGYVRAVCSPLLSGMPGTENISFLHQII
jgi:4'-phosphopantetheinyl transferase